MRSVLRLPIYTTAAACAAVVLAGCGGGGGGGGSTTPVNSLSLVGNVFDSGTGDPVSGASVQIPSLTQTTTTDASGNFRFDGISSTFAGGELDVNKNGFDSEATTIAVNGSALQVAPVGLTQSGSNVNMAPGSGGTVSQSVGAVSGLPSASLTVPANSLPAGSNQDVGLTSVVNTPADELVSSLSVAGQSVGDISAHSPEIEVRIRPRGLVLSTPAQMALPLPFALPGGSSVQLIQKKNGQWKVVGVATVDASGAFAVGPITEFQPTGVQAWHGFTRTQHNMPNVTLTEKSLADIQNNVNNLPDRTFVEDKIIKAGQTARITARFNWSFDTPSLPTSPVDEESLVLGKAQHRLRLHDHLYGGMWDITGGPVQFKVFEEDVTVKRFLNGQPVSVAGSFTATHGRPAWPRPGEHNQGGVQ